MGGTLRLQNYKTVIFAIFRSGMSRDAPFETSRMELWRQTLDYPETFLQDFATATSAHDEL
jgi:hypothetical protein